LPVLSCSVLFPAALRCSLLSRFGAFPEGSLGIYYRVCTNTWPYKPYSKYGQCIKGNVPGGKTATHFLSRRVAAFSAVLYCHVLAPFPKGRSEFTIGFVQTRGRKKPYYSKYGQCIKGNVPGGKTATHFLSRRVAAFACFCLPVLAFACFCLRLPAFACRCLLSLACACLCLLLPAFACFCLLLLAFACLCFLLLAFACVCLLLPAFPSSCLPVLAFACFCLRLLAFACFCLLLLACACLCFLLLGSRFVFACFCLVLLGSRFVLAWFCLLLLGSRFCCLVLRGFAWCSLTLTLPLNL
jgi:hypothetical protein